MNWSRSVGLLIAVLFLAALGTAHGQDATWNTNPGSSNWNTNTNWTPATVPTGIATFGSSTATSIGIGLSSSVGEMLFNAGAPAYFFSVSNTTLTITGAGIVNNSSNRPTISNNSIGTTIFQNNSTAGDAIIITNGLTAFQNNSTAGSATITNNSGGITGFVATSSAGNATIINNGGSTSFQFNSNAANATITTNSGGITGFVGASTAGNATITTNNGGILGFQGTSTAGNATITTNNGGFTLFQNTTTGGNAQFITNSGGVFDISQLTSGGMTAGSIEGAGIYSLGSKTLTVGSNNLSTQVSGLIADGGAGGGTGGVLVKVGTGTLTLSGANTYSGGTSINTGTLEAAHATAGSIDALGSGAVTLNGGTLRSTVTGTLSNSVTFGGGFTSTLTAATGQTLTLNGFVSIIAAGANARFGSATDNGTIVLAPSGTAQGPSATIEVVGGTLQAGSANGLSYTSSVSATTVDAGATLDFNSFPGFIKNLQGGGTVTLGTAALTILAGDFSGVIAGSGGLTKTSTGTLVLSGTNTYTGGTTIGAGILQLGNGGPSGSILGDVVDNAVFAINRSDAFTFGGVISGTGSFQQLGTGTTILTAANSYGGGTTISAGVLNVSADNNLGAASGGLTFNGGTLQFGSTFNLASTRTITLNGGGGTFDTNGFNSNVSQGITGIGGLTKTGLGTLTLSGSNSYSGGTVLNAGTLVVNNAQALGLGNVIVNAGILRADPQAINVKGNYTQNAGGTLLLQVAGAGSGQYDFLNVSGNANLGGTLQLTNLGYTPKSGDQLTLVTAGGSVTSRFAGWVNPFTTGPGINTIDLVYGRNSVVLKFLNILPPTPPVPPTPPIITTIDFASFAQTPNQFAAANLLDAVQLDPGAANLMAFLYKEPFADLPSDFNKISPESLTAFYEISFSAANIQRLNLENRLEDIRNASGYASGTGATVYLEDKADGKSSKNPPMLPPVREKRWDFWSTSFGDFVHVDSDFNARGYKFTTGGIDLGIDYRLTDHFAFGLMGSYAHTWSDLRPGSIDVNSGRGGLYATYFNRCLYINGGIYGGYNSYDSSRRGLQGNANGNSDGAEFSTFVSGGYDFHLGHLTVGPIASLQYTNVYVDSFRETGSLAPLSIHSDSEESLRSDVGFRASYQWRIGSIQLEPFLKATWEHEFKYSTLPITAGFADISGPSAIFLGPSEGHDSAVVDAGISVSWTPCISTYVSYNGLLGRDRYDSNGVSGGIRIRF